MALRQPVRRTAMQAFRPVLPFLDSFHTTPARAFRDASSRPDSETGVLTKDVREADPMNWKRRFVCAACGVFITQEEFAAHKNGASRHTFCNPHGLVFEVMLFNRAPGCLILGPSTHDFTWFPGYAWSVACCSSCSSHLGWHYEHASRDYFFGIIAARIVIENAH